MNILQKAICLIFSVILLIIGFIFLEDEKSLASVFSITFSGIGFYFLVSGKKKINISFLKLVKRFGFFLLIVIFIGGIGYGIFWLDEEFIPKHNSKYIKIIDKSSLKFLKSGGTLKLLEPDTYLLSIRLMNKSEKIVERIDLTIEYYSKNGVFIQKEIESDITRGQMIDTDSTISLSKEISLLFVPEMKHKKEVKIYKAYFR